MRYVSLLWEVEEIGHARRGHESVCQCDSYLQMNYFQQTFRDQKEALKLSLSWIGTRHADR